MSAPNLGEEPSERLLGLGSAGTEDPRTERQPQRDRPAASHPPARRPQGPRTCSVVVGDLGQLSLLGVVSIDPLR